MFQSDSYKMCDMRQIASLRMSLADLHPSISLGVEGGGKEPVYVPPMTVPLLWETKLHTRTDQRT